jgi:uncharacterized protein
MELHDEVGPVVGRVIGTEDATPLEFWVGVGPGAYLQLDDVVALERVMPGTGELVRMYGVVTQVRARHEGARFDSDVFLIEDGVLPAEVSEAALVQATRFEPELFVPPRPGEIVHRATGAAREEALLFAGMTKKLPCGLSRDDEPFYLNFEFIDGSRGAHVNISGISGVATKTSYATFLLYGIFHSGLLGAEAHNTKALVFNVKGEDLLFLDHKNTALDPEAADRYKRLDLPVGAFESLEVWAPPKRGDTTGRPDVAGRTFGVRSFFWTLDDFCRQELLPFLFADAEDDRQQYTLVVHNVAHRLKQLAQPAGDGAVTIEGTTLRSFHDLVEFLVDRVTDDDDDTWRGRAISMGTGHAFVRRLHGAVRHVAHLVRADIAHPDRHRVELEQQVTVIDLHNLSDRAKRFVVGVILRRAFEAKEQSGRSHPLQFVMLDELNKYAPREGSSPIKELLLDIAERGRSLGVILLGCQQTASEVERRIIANSSIRVAGRLDSAEAGRDEYGWLPGIHRRRAAIVKPGTMLVSQPELPVPLVVEFPFPAWATRAAEAGANPAAVNAPSDPFSGLP